MIKNDIALRFDKIRFVLRYVHRTICIRLLAHHFPHDLASCRLRFRTKFFGSYEWIGRRRFYLRERNIARVSAWSITLMSMCVH